MTDIADRSAIQDLLGRYGWAMDHGDGEGYAALFTEDGVMRGFGEPIKGRAALAGMVEATIGMSKGKWRHHLTNLFVSDIEGEGGDGGRVEAKAYQLVTDWTKVPGVPHMMVDATWVLARAGSGWLIETLDLAFVGPDA